MLRLEQQVRVKNEFVSAMEPRLRLLEGLMLCVEDPRRLHSGGEGTFHGEAIRGPHTSFMTCDHVMPSDLTSCHEIANPDSPSAGQRQEPMALLQPVIVIDDDGCQHIVLGADQAANDVVTEWKVTDVEETILRQDGANARTHFSASLSA